MDATELDIAIDELETRVERLRALYEQFFMGIEKIPPQVVQKDVDRRLYMLRREQIRNTARRFKLQTIIQRYNTFQQYWMRIMREIENGTYRRHVLRAERTTGVANMLTAAERKRMGLPEVATTSTQPTAGPQSVDAPDQNAAPQTTRSPSSMVPAEKVSPAAIRSQIEHELGLLLDDDLDELSSLAKFDLGKELDDPLLSSLPPPRRKPRKSSRAAGRRTVPPSSTRPKPKTEPRPPDSEHTQRGLGPVAPPPSSRRSLRPIPVIPIEGPRIPEDAGAIPRAVLETAALQAPPPPRIAPAAPARGLRLPARSAVAGRGLPPPPKPQAAATTTSATGVTQPERPKAAVAAAPSPAPDSTDAKSPTSTARESSPKGLPDVRESVIPRSARPAARSKPPLAATAQTPKTAQSPELRHPGPSAGGSVERATVERVAEKLLTARKQTHESSTVSVDALTRKLEATAAELRKKHVGKRIDFDVVIKDGKAIVKPIVR